MRQYYINKNGANLGPYTLDQVKQQGILPNDLIWFEGASSWAEARTIPELNSPAPTIPPPINEKVTQSSGFWKYATISAVALMIVMAFWALNNKEAEQQPITTNDSIENSNGTMAVDVVTSPSTEDYPPDEVIGGEVDIKEPSDRKEYLRQHWRDLVKIEIVDAKYDNFGGMSDVFVVAKNGMEYEIEKLIFEAEYILENGNIWKSRMFQLENIPASQNSLILQIEGSHRGKTIKFKMINIVCKGIGIN